MFNAKQMLKIELSVQRKWCERFNPLHEQDALQSELSNPDMNPQWAVSSLSLLEKYIRTRGVIHIFDGELEPGWKSLHLAWQYSALRVKVSFDYYDQMVLSNGVDEPTDFDFFDVSSASWSLFESMAFEERSFADWCGNRLLQSLSPDDLIFRPEWRDESAWEFLVRRKYPPLEMFALALYCMWSERSSPGSIGSLGVFQPVVDSWSNPQVVNSTVERICELHMSYVNKDRDQIVGYGIDPFHLYPVEIAAIGRVLRDMGGPPLDSDHPLLRSYFGAGPFGGTRSPGDKWIDEVVNYCRRTMPELEIPWMN